MLCLYLKYLENPNMEDPLSPNPHITPQNFVKFYLLYLSIQSKFYLSGLSGLNFEF